MPVYSVKAHKEIVNSIDGVGGLGIGDGAPEIVTGSRDGIRCFSLNVKKKIHLKYPEIYPAIHNILFLLLAYRNCEGMGSQTKGFTCSQHGTYRRRDQTGLLDSCIWYVQDESSLIVHKASIQDDT